MGSPEEEELFQMVRDFIESDSSSPNSPTTAEANALNHNLTLQEILGMATDGESEVLEEVLKSLRRMGCAGETTNINLKKRLIVTCLRKKNYQASLCQTSCAATYGKYEYIDVMLKNGSSGDGGVSTRLIVDIDFRSQFELARPTAAYRELLGNVPMIFVGTEEKLHEVISVLCAAAQMSLKESGLHIPPWRRASYVESKWLSANLSNRDSSASTSSTGLAPHTNDSKRHRSAGAVLRGEGPGLSRQFSKMGINCC